MEVRSEQLQTAPPAGRKQDVVGDVGHLDLMGGWKESDGGSVDSACKEGCRGGA